MHQINAPYVAGGPGVEATLYKLSGGLHRSAGDDLHELSDRRRQVRFPKRFRANQGTCRNATQASGNASQERLGSQRGDNSVVYPKSSTPLSAN